MKVGYVLFVIAAVYAILRPDDTTVVANWLGRRPRRRPARLRADHRVRVHHAQHLLRFKDLELRYARLARAVALEGARAPDALAADVALRTNVARK